MPAKAPERPAVQSSVLPLPDAVKLVEDAEKRLWTPEGANALAYLRGRGLSDATIKAARLGRTPGVAIPVRDGTAFWTVEGITIPWLDRDRLAMVQIRRRKGEEPKYVRAFAEDPSIYPTPEAVRPGKPLVIVEGEFDALLLGQALGELAAVMTLGSASSRPKGAIYLAMLRCPRWYVATDADPAGDKAASGWPEHAIRVRPPSGKDWTDAHKAGIDLRRWWIDHLDATETPGPPNPDVSKVPPSGIVEPSTPSTSGTEAAAASMPWPERGPRDRRLGHCWLPWHFPERIYT
jgi:hypothetical protein